MKIFNRFGLFLLAFLILTPSIYSFPASVDTIRVLAIRVEFKEDSAATTTGNGKFDLSMSTDEYQVDPPPHNRSYFQDHLIFLKNYFLKVSGGRLYVEGDVYPLGQNEAYQLDNPMTEYNPNTTPDEIDAGLARLFRDALQKADEDPAIDFSRYQSFIIFHAGVGKDVELGYDETPQDIPSLFITSDFLQQNIGNSYVSVDGDSVKIPNGILLPETESQDGYQLGLNGMLVSNFGSQLGWPDLFSPDTRRTGIGRFGLMDAGLFNGDGLLPALPCAWTRIQAGWETPLEINYSSGDEFPIYHTLSAHPEKVYRVPINQKEYFLVENRNAGKSNLDSLRFEMARGRSDYPTVKEVLKTYFQNEAIFSDSTGVLVDVENPDIGLPGSGCLIWHVDENVIDANRAANRINADPYHRGVDLEEADGSQDIGEEFDFLSPGGASATGWVLDMWYRGNTAPLFKNEFSASSVPNSRSYYNRANSHITISDFSAADSLMTFRVKLDIFQQNFPRRIDPQVYGKITSLKTTDIDFDGKGDLILTTDKGGVLAINRQGVSAWGSDSLQIVSFDKPILPPPALFRIVPPNSSRTTAMLLLSPDGFARVYGFDLSTHTADSLYSFQCPDSITTHPVGYYEPDSVVRIFWGCADGGIYYMTDINGIISIDQLFKLPEAIHYIHLNAQDQLITITRSGRVFHNEVEIGQVEVPYTYPAGNLATAVTRDGRFLMLEEEADYFAEEGLFRFDSPLITHPLVRVGDNRHTFFVAGNNRLYSFHYNFTLSENFPVKIYPDRDAEFTLSPLLARFHTTGLKEDFGVLVSDPAGLIDGFDLQGKRLIDFPLSAGDSLATTPVLLDMDGDGDVELAAVTTSGILYVWDLPAAYERWGWNQLYYNELNANRSTAPASVLLPDPNLEKLKNQLLPENKVYNWPNPNIENYTFIRYFLTDVADVNIKIFDASGDLVDEFRGPNTPNAANELRWDLSGVQSGVYLARIEAYNSRRKEVHIIKIAVIK